MPKFIKIYYRDPELDTVKKLFDAEKVVDLKVSEFLDQKDPYTERKNRDALFMAYTEQQKKDLGLNSSADISESTTIYPPATLYIQTDKATMNLITNESKFTRTEDYDAFLSAQMKNIVENRDYIKSDVSKTYPEATLWVWSKSFEHETFNSTSIGGRILNLSDFIEDLRITTADTGGSFQITLPMVTVRSIGTIKNNGELGNGSTWRIDSTQSKKYENSTGQLERVYSTSMHEDLTRVTSTAKDPSKIKRTSNATRQLHIGDVAFNVNDIVFIKFERLKLESNLHVDDLYVDPHALNGEVFDMIGLIDSVTTDTNSSDVSITIAGRTV
jgi:hypothetical protein